MIGALFGVAVGAVTIVLSLLIFVPLYILCALLETQVLKAYSYDKLWMAWVPFANIWALADVAFRGMQTAHLWWVEVPLPIIAYKAYVIAFIPLNFILRLIFGAVHLEFVVTFLLMVLQTVFFASIMQQFAKNRQLQFTITQCAVGGFIMIYGMYLIKNITLNPNEYYSNYEMNPNHAFYDDGSLNNYGDYENPGDAPLGDKKE